jgi:hypothetical protein
MAKEKSKAPPKVKDVQRDKKYNHPHLLEKILSRYESSTGPNAPISVYTQNQGQTGSSFIFPAKTSKKRLLFADRSKTRKPPANLKTFDPVSQPDTRTLQHSSTIDWRILKNGTTLHEVNATSPSVIKSCTTKKLNQTQPKQIQPESMTWKKAELTNNAAITTQSKSRQKWANHLVEQCEGERNAAIKIQSKARQKITVTEIGRRKEEYTAALTIQATFRQSTAAQQVKDMAIKKKVESAAAVAIQARCRQRAAAEYVAKLKQRISSENIQRISSSSSSTQETNEKTTRSETVSNPAQKEEITAKISKSNSVGDLSERADWAKRRAKEKARDEQRYAALQIQKANRRRRAKEKLQKKIEEKKVEKLQKKIHNSAAIRIQSKCRARKAKNEVVALNEDYGRRKRTALGIVFEKDNVANDHKEAIKALQEGTMGIFTQGNEKGKSEGTLDNTTATSTAMSATHLSHQEAEETSLEEASRASRVIGKIVDEATLLVIKRKAKESICSISDTGPETAKKTSVARKSTLGGNRNIRLSFNHSSDIGSLEGGMAEEEDLDDTSQLDTFT